MTRADAERLVAKLRSLTVERGATAAEAAVAAAKAAALVQRFDLTESPRPSAPPRRARPAPAKDFADWVGGSAHARGDWDFDWRTGRASSNVKVHEYKDRANWRIEIPI